jgi:hypothetical protein
MSATPIPVLIEFLHALNRLATEWDEGFDPVLRGSLLLHHWYGDRARPPADLDIECFVHPVPAMSVSGNEFYDPDDEPGDIPEGRFGRYGEYESLVDMGKAMCRYAAESADWRRPGGSVSITFKHVESPPGDGASLWVYGTPGQRYYSAWEWPGHRPSGGRLQLDLSTPGPYTLDDLGVVNESFTAPGDATFLASVYSKEAMLAAKVSWLVRGLFRHRDGSLSWSGEPKDLFDAHLLATDDALRPDVFRRAMLAVGAGDQLNWNDIDNLFEVRRADVSDAVFGNWAAFARRDPDLAPAGPVAM